MEDVPIYVPNIGEVDGSSTVVLLGPNGSGKSTIARQIAGHVDQTRFISAQRRTHLSDQLQVFSRDAAENNVRSQISSAYSDPTQQSNEIDILFSGLIGEHFSRLSADDKARSNGETRGHVTDTSLSKLEKFWARVFPGRSLDITSFNPQVTRSIGSASATYNARSMSDGERTSLYLAARILNAKPGLLVIDEPELHFHSALAAAYWDGLEALRPDVRFVYATHDLAFALSRRNARIILVRDRDSCELLANDFLPDALIEELLSAATLSVSARRFVFFEGEGLQGSAPKGQAARFFRAWFNDAGTVSLGVGNRDSVIAAVRSFRSSNLVRNAEIIGILDSDHYTDSELTHLSRDSSLISLRGHEFESLLALPEVIRAVAAQIGFARDPWPDVEQRLRRMYARDKGRIIALRARSQFDASLRGLFTPDQLDGSFEEVRSKHSLSVLSNNWQKALDDAMTSSEQTANDLENGDSVGLLRLLPGKGIIGEICGVLSISPARYFDLIVNALYITSDNLETLGTALETALSAFLPHRKVQFSRLSIGLERHT